MRVWDGGAESPKIPNRSLMCHRVPAADAVTTATASASAAATR